MYATESKCQYAQAGGHVAALASGSSTRPLLSPPLASTLPIFLCSGPSPFEATRQPPKGRNETEDLRPKTAHRYAAFWAEAALLVGEVRGRGRGRGRGGDRARARVRATLTLSLARRPYPLA